jgi:hypothetical protein
MTDRDDELNGVARIGKDSVYLEGIDGGSYMTLWQRDPLRDESRAATRSSREGNEAVMLTNEQALILLEVLQKNRARIEANIVKRAVETVKSRGF